jgi:hypothetical protein
MPSDKILRLKLRRHGGQPRGCPVPCDGIMDVDVEAVLEGRARPDRLLLNHLCRAKVDTDHPQAGDPFSLLQLWRVTQLLLETAAQEGAAHAHHVQQLEQRLTEEVAARAAEASAREADSAALRDELATVRNENAVLRGEKFGVVAVPPAAAAPSGPTLTEEEGRALQEKVRRLQEQYAAMMKEKTAIAEELRRWKDDAHKDGPQPQPQDEGTAPQIADLTAQLERQRKDLEEAQRAAEGKVSESAQFRNLKAMLAQKNELLRDVRGRLRKYEADPSPGAAEDD